MLSAPGLAQQGRRQRCEFATTDEKRASPRCAAIQPTQREDLAETAKEPPLYFGAMERKNGCGQIAVSVDVTALQ